MAPQGLGILVNNGTENGNFGIMAVIWGLYRGYREYTRPKTGDAQNQ